MSDGSIDLKHEARAKVFAEPLETLNPAQPELFAQDAMWPYFDRLRTEAPVHYTPESAYGPFWSITKYNDIMAVDTNHQVFSSEDGIALQSLEAKAQTVGRPTRQSFIGMDPPKHDSRQRRAGEPGERRRRTWRECGAGDPGAGGADPGRTADRRDFRLGRPGVQGTDRHDPGDPVRLPVRGAAQADLLVRHDDQPARSQPSATSWQQKREQIDVCFEAFDGLWKDRINADPKFDLISMMAHAEATRNMDIHEYHGNVTLLIIGGNDTTRNTISGSVYALNKNPDQYDKLRANPGLIPSMVSETIRWQTPLAHMSRTATQDFEFGGKTIREGDKVMMWYVSGNRDEDVIENPNSYIIDRARPRTHMSFGFGIHRCVGNRLAELQLTIVWEEMLKRFPVIQVVEVKPVRTHSIFVKGYETLPVVIPRRT